MKITAIELGMLRVPLRTPFRTALRTVEAIEDVVVQVRTACGRTGHGSAPATALITGDTHGSIIAAIRGSIAPQVLGQDAGNLASLCARVQAALVSNSSAKAAVDIALHDLWAQQHGAPLYHLLGGGTPELRTDITISMDTPEAMVAACEAALARGYATLKIKVGQEVALDVARVLAVHAAMAGRAVLRLDANQGWTARETVRAMQALESAGVALELLEQPVKAADVAGLKYVSERIATPVMADESAFSPRQVLALLQERAVDIINIKLMKAGGISMANRIVDIAAMHGVRCMVGCMIESSISAAAAAHLAVARADVVTLVDLDGPALGRFDPVLGNTRFDEARITIGDGAGLGITALNDLERLG